MPIAMVSSLKMEPGSNDEETSLRLVAPSSIVEVSVTSNIGVEHAARISPVVGSVTMTEPELAE